MAVQRPRVLLVNWRDTRHPEGGGSERYVERMAEGLARRGYQVAIQCAAHDRAPRLETVDGVRFRRAGNKFTVYLHALVAIAFARADLVVDVQNGMPFFARLVARCPVLILVHHLHEQQWYSAFGRRLGRLGWWIESTLAPRLFRNCRYVTVSDVTRRELADLGVESSRVNVVCNGVEPPPPTQAAPAAEPTLVLVSRLVPHKQIEHAIDAVVALAPHWPDLRLEVVGEGPWYPVLAEYASRRGVADRVRLHGWMTEQAKHETLARAWVHLCPSAKEGWGIVIMEAAGHGVPSVAYRSAGGVAESIVDNRTGLLANGFHDFVAKIEVLLADAERRTAMGEAGRRRAATFDWETSLDEFEHLVREVAGLPSGELGVQSAHDLVEQGAR
ncbi:glycosyltransferase involved in cell wall biosynthesis [Herbihabitans rhizosphaerae]|uniref:Glycosyltransferase involved in cell wall biosynthesis n=1 Tax=Herbihabitans rhizosphaerae TaxID=1872711 RepID=A0A4Q7L8N9_9PSEU|nr:glycosyltransferase family 4 protein [Herbihabitans rhizosphaerae]RZS44772.1 glycosyltransferase involved in cell wall biosynthesis [Herbihabitans rhizosphaerae]